jgi:protein-tyrosine phosphatase
VRAGGARGYPLQAHRARELHRDDYLRFDLLLAADHGNLRDLRARAPDGRVDRVALALAHAGIAAPLEVPDPYYGSAADFELVVELAERIADGLLHKLALGPMLGRN